MRAHVQKMKVWNELSGSENPVCFGGYLGDDSEMFQGLFMKCILYHPEIVKLYTIGHEKFL